jgi:hypothetical protein
MALLRRVRTLTLDDLHALDDAVRALAAERAHKDIDKGYVYAWWNGPLPRREDQDELDELFADVVIALAGGLTGLDVERVAAQFAPKPSILDGLTRLFLPPRPRRQIQDASIGLIDNAVAPWDPRLAVVATWNMACAVALREHLKESTRATLEAAWRRAIGELPA